MPTFVIHLNGKKRCFSGFHYADIYYMRTELLTINRNLKKYSSVWCVVIESMVFIYEYNCWCLWQMMHERQIFLVFFRWFLCSWCYAVCNLWWFMRPVTQRDGDTARLGPVKLSITDTRIQLCNSTIWRTPIADGTRGRRTGVNFPTSVASELQRDTMARFWSFPRGKLVALPCACTSSGQSLLQILKHYVFHILLNHL